MLNLRALITSLSDCCVGVEMEVERDIVPCDCHSFLLVS